MSSNTLHADWVTVTCSMSLGQSSLVQFGARLIGCNTAFVASNWQGCQYRSFNGQSLEPQMIRPATVANSTHQLGLLSPCKRQAVRLLKPHPLHRQASPPSPYTSSLPTGLLQSRSPQARPPLPLLHLLMCKHPLPARPQSPHPLA